MTMSNGFISGAPNDHRCGPDNRTRSGLYQHNRNSGMSWITIKKFQPLYSSPHHSDDAIFKNQAFAVHMFTFPNGRTNRMRFMMLYKADRQAVPSDSPREMPAVPQPKVATEDLQRSSKRVRLRRSDKGFLVTDGPFTETKELIGG